MRQQLICAVSTKLQNKQNSITNRNPICYDVKKSDFMWSEEWSQSFAIPLSIVLGWGGVKECLVYLRQSHFCRHKIFIHKKQNHPRGKIKKSTIYSGAALAVIDVFDKVINNGKFFRNKVLADGRRKFLVGCRIRLLEGNSISWLLCTFVILTRQLYNYPPFYSIYVKTLFTA